ncbi:MAG: Fe-S cluster assembly protein HesB [Acidimicrobiia bacterium]|nr:Fe-S cluster assembly protein HesB [Acidimicrobiia bacterium]
MAGPASLPFTDDDAANRLLATDPLALLIGMLLDQQFPMERAFFSPFLLHQRLGGTLDAGAIASMNEEDLVEVFQGPPALHRFPGSMATRTRAMCEAVVADYAGDPSAIWSTATDGRELLKRLEALPGFGKAKSRIFVGVLGKRLGAGPPGWEEAAADWPSIADVDSFEKVFELREHKRAMKAAKKASP